MGAGYLGRKRIDPVALAGAFALSGGMVMVMIAIGAVDATKFIDRTTKTIFVPLDPVPPEPLPKPVERKIETPAPPAGPMIREPIVKPFEPSPNLLDTDVVPPTGDVFPGSGIEGGTGTGAGTVTEPVKPAPVFVDARVDPRYADAFQPIYPSRERFAENEGRVTVRVLIGTDGRVKAVERSFATSDAFFDATRDRALRYWRFRPATRDGVAVEAWREMTVRFQLES
ncbi:MULTISPECIES: energy transducer TonB [unclassified Sphingomonas]|uniref:energy transducer TonB n=1 Tax=unclassified Sphingomonas TaxID=196159 RepID=UPI000835E4ED|nr:MULTISPECIES: energy transducer TonB [unclassified Sphingomonas]